MYCSNVHYWGKQGKLGKLGGKVQGRNMLLAILAIILAVWLSGEALQIVVKRRKAKSKGEKERYKHLNRPLSLLDTLLKMYANSLLDKE